MTTTTVAILACPDRPSAVPPTSVVGRTLAKVDKVARYRRNPRTTEYMRELARTVLPGAEIIEVEGAVPVAPVASAAIADAGAIVLLWPDATGFGWAPTERAVFRVKPRAASVFALTGRRRYIELSPGTLFAFRVRRVVERLWLGEAVMAGALLLTAPFLVAWDALRGRR
jgi:hypothetical protein